MIKPMLAKDFEKHRSKIEFPVYLQPKLDGVRLLWDGEKFLSRTGKTSLKVPLKILKAVEKHFKGFPLDGELYRHLMDFDSISGQARRVKSDQVERLEYWVFDAMIDEPFKKRQELLGEKLRTVLHSDIVRLKTIISYNAEDIEYWLKAFIRDGFEGLMVRRGDRSYEEKRSDALLKYKRWRDCEAVVKDLVPGKGKHLGRLGALMVSDVEGRWTCRVGTGFSDREREQIWNAPSKSFGRVITLKYQNLTSKGCPRFPVFVRFREEE